MTTPDQQAKLKFFQDLLANITDTKLNSLYDLVTHRTVQPGLNSLSNAVKEAKKKGITEIYLLNGTHDEKGESVAIGSSISIIGESREHCIVMGGLKICGKKEDDVNVSNLTLRKSRSRGIAGTNNGASIHLDNMSVENSGQSGVYVYGSKRNTMKNCKVSFSKLMGLLVCGKGKMTIEGNNTLIHDNCTDNRCERNEFCGLHAYDSSSSINIVSPLTKEMISKDNGDNYGGKGKIESVDKDGKVLESSTNGTWVKDGVVHVEPGVLRVKPGLHSLTNALEEAQRKGITDIFLEDGEHDEKGGSVNIFFKDSKDIYIYGSHRDKCQIKGGLSISKTDVFVTNLTICNSKTYGLVAKKGSSIHLDTVSVENSRYNGVLIASVKPSTMTDCTVSYNRKNGIEVWKGGFLTIKGTGTTIRHNATSPTWVSYGLNSYDSSARINLAPDVLIDEFISDNHGDRNFGGAGTIAIVDGDRFIKTIHPNPILLSSDSESSDIESGDIIDLTGSKTIESSDIIDLTSSKNTEDWLRF